MSYLAASSARRAASPKSFTPPRPANRHLRAGLSKSTTSAFALKPRKVFAVSTQRSRVGRRHTTRCSAEQDGDKKNSTLSNLDSLLGVEPEEKVVAPPKESISPAPTTPPPPPAPITPQQLNSEGGGDEENPDVSERIIGSLCYLLPLMDGLKYSRFLLQQYPLFAVLLLPLEPVIKTYFQLGFLQIAIFFAMYLGVAKNNSLPRYVRFNAMQAIVLDIFLILPDVLTTLFNGIDGPPKAGFGLEMQILLNNTTFLYVYICTVVAVGACLLGKTVELPIIGSAAKQQTPEE